MTATVWTEPVRGRPKADSPGAGPVPDLSGPPSSPPCAKSVELTDIAVHVPSSGRPAHLAVLRPQDACVGIVVCTGRNGPLPELNHPIRPDRASDPSLQSCNIWHRLRKVGVPMVPDPPVDRVEPFIAPTPNRTRNGSRSPVQPGPTRCTTPIPVQPDSGRAATRRASASSHPGMAR